MVKFFVPEYVKSPVPGLSHARTGFGEIPYLCSGIALRGAFPGADRF